MPAFHRDISGNKSSTSSRKHLQSTNPFGLIPNFTRRKYFMKIARVFALFIVALVIAANTPAQEKQIDTLLKQYHEYGQFNGAVLVVRTDLRDNGQNATYYARMTDLEAGFEPNVEVTDDTGAPASFLGDYKGIAIQGRDVVVTWADTRSGTNIYFARAVDAAAAGGPLVQ
jgi:hypothetical protein